MTRVFRRTPSASTCCQSPATCHGLSEGPTRRYFKPPFHTKSLQWPSRCRIPRPNVAMCTSRGQLFAIGREGYCSDPTRMASKCCPCCSRRRVQSRTVQSSEAKASFLPLGREDHRPDPMSVAFECSPDAPVAATESRILPLPEARPAVWHRARRLQS